MVEGRMVGVHDMTTQGHARGYKQMDNRFDIGNHLHLGGYQTTSGNTGWSDDASMAFYPNDRLGGGSYNRFVGNSGGYVQNAYGTSMQSTKTGLAPQSTSTTHVARNTIVMGAGIHTSSDLHAGEEQKNVATKGQETQMNPEDVAHHFVFRYYSLLHNNPSGLYNLYAKTAQLCKPDAEGTRVTVTGHEGIKKFYSKFLPTQLTFVIRRIEVQNIVGQTTLAILIVVEVTTRVRSVPETQVISQLVTLAADQARARYHILNDIAVINTRAIENKMSEKPSDANRSPDIPASVNGATQMQTKVEELAHTMAITGKNAKDSKDKSKVVIFGLPSNITEKEVREALMERMRSRGWNEGRITRMDLKKQQENSEKSPVYAFLHLDSSETGEALVGDNFIIRGRSLTVDIYKKSNTNRSPTYAKQNTRNQPKPIVW